MLGGIISPMDGIGPNDLEIESLISRVEKKEVKEARKVTKTELNAQREYLGKFKEGHGFANAPGKKEKIGFEVKNSTLNIDHNHGYNTTLNEKEFFVNEVLMDKAAIIKAYTPLKKGDTGKKVKELQFFLSDTPFDGIFDATLESKVKVFQKKNKLAENGIVDINTLKKIIEIFHALVPDKSISDKESLFYGMIRDKFCNEGELLKKK